MAGEGKLRHKRHGWMQAIRRGDSGKNLVFFDDMPDFFLPQRNVEFQLTNGQKRQCAWKLQPEEGKSFSLLVFHLSVQEARCCEGSRRITA